MPQKSVIVCKSCWLARLSARWGLIRHPQTWRSHRLRNLWRVTTIATMVTVAPGNGDRDSEGGDAAPAPTQPEVRFGPRYPMDTRGPWHSRRGGQGSALGKLRTRPFVDHTGSAILLFSARCCAELPSSSAQHAPNKRRPLSHNLRAPSHLQSNPPNSCQRLPSKRIICIFRITV